GLRPRGFGRPQAGTDRADARPSPAGPRVRAPREPAGRGCLSYGGQGRGDGVARPPLRRRDSPHMTEPTARYRTRALVLTGVLVIVLAAVVVRLAYLQLYRHEELARLAERQYSKTIPLRPQRGPIFDRNGYALAVSAEVESVFAVPGRIADRAWVAATLAPRLGERPRDLEERLQGDRPFVWLKRKIPPVAAQGIRALRLPGVGTLPESLRFYPSRELGAHLLGFVGTDDRGLGAV